MSVNTQVNHPAVTAAGIAAAVRSRSCPMCWATAHVPCSVSGPVAYHLRRLLAAEDAGLISRADMNSIISGLQTYADHVLIYEAAL